MLAAANYYLDGDFEECVKVCSAQYSPDCGEDSLFKGNLLRLKGLALLKIACKEDEVEEAKADKNNLY